MICVWVYDALLCRYWFKPVLLKQITCFLTRVTTRALGLWCLVTPLVQAELERPQRIVSMNQCTDELLLKLADPQQIQSVTHFIKDPSVSWDAEQAERYPSNQGHVEELLDYAPDLILVGEFNARSSVMMLQELGLNVHVFRHPQGISDVYEQIHRVAHLVGYPERGAKLVTQIRTHFEAQPKPGRPLQAVVYQPNGFTMGRNSVVEDVLAAAGYVNAAADWGDGQYSYYPLEQLIERQPDVLILDPQSLGTPALAHQILRHPALAQAFGDLRLIEMPPQAWSCGGPHLTSAVTLLRELRRELL